MPPGPKSLARQAQLLGQLAFADENPRLVLGRRTRDLVLRADWQLGPGHLLDVVPQHTGGAFDDRRRLFRHDDDGTGLPLLDKRGSFGEERGGDRKEEESCEDAHGGLRVSEHRSIQRHTWGASA